MVTMCPAPAQSTQTSRVRATLRTQNIAGVGAWSLNQARMDETTIRSSTLLLLTSERFFTTDISDSSQSLT